MPDVKFCSLGFQDFEIPRLFSKQQRQSAKVGTLLLPLKRLIEDMRAPRFVDGIWVAPPLPEGCKLMGGGEDVGEDERFTYIYEAAGGGKNTNATRPIAPTFIGQPPKFAGNLGAQLARVIFLAVHGFFLTHTVAERNLPLRRSLNVSKKSAQECDSLLVTCLGFDKDVAVAYLGRVPDANNAEEMAEATTDVVGGPALCLANESVFEFFGGHPIANIERDAKNNYPPISRWYSSDVKTLMKWPNEIMTLSSRS
jgi:hypothetical protein